VQERGVGQKFWKAKSYHIWTGGDEILISSKLRVAYRILRKDEPRNLLISLVWMWSVGSAAHTETHTYLVLLLRLPYLPGYGSCAVASLKFVRYDHRTFLASLSLVIHSVCSATVKVENKQEGNSGGV
jgi:hypothetical protein